MTASYTSWFAEDTVTCTVTCGAQTQCTQQPADIQMPTMHQVIVASCCWHVWIGVVADIAAAAAVESLVVDHRLLF